MKKIEVARFFYDMGWINARYGDKDYSFEKAWNSYVRPYCMTTYVSYPLKRSKIRVFHRKHWIKLWKQVIRESKVIRT